MLDAVDYGLEYITIKRVIDLMVSSLGLLLGAPLIGAACLLIVCTSRGTPFYSQIRIGRNGCPFKIFKLRSMFLDAEKEGVRWASAQDPRVTWVGQILRKTRIDELPQFWNVLKGEMSVIGPRPERPEFVKQLMSTMPYYWERHLIQPGITGWAQINYHYGASVEDSCWKLKYDLYYLRHLSIALDLQILIQTIGALMKGAR